MSFSDISSAARHRSRLSHSDVKLILFLIVQIKPFKYVGDRTLSQSRKWDLIQQKLEQYKLRHGLLAAVVPTVRTLQRQMATALRKAQHRHQTDHYEPFLVFATLSRTSLLADLELAVLELYNLSEAYKTGQTVGPLPELVSRAFEEDLVKDLMFDSTDTEMANPFARHNSDASYHSHQSCGSADLGVDRDDSDVPESIAPIVSKIRMMVDQNRSFYTDCMSMLRLHSAMVNERCMKLEEFVISSAREAMADASGSGPLIKHEGGSVAPTAMPIRELGDFRLSTDGFEELGPKDRMLQSILQLLN